MSTDPRTEALAAIEQAADRLAEADRLVTELWSIGVWVTAEDSSDNRQRRRLLREVDWAVSGALRAIASLPELADDPEAVATLRTGLSALAAIAEPLPDTVSDIDDDSALDGPILDLRERLEVLRPQAGRLASHLRQAIRAQNGRA